MLLLLLLPFAAAQGRHKLSPCDYDTDAACQGPLQQQQHATCTISIRGDGQPHGSIQSASMNCTGGRVSVTAHHQLLGKFMEKFTGVTWDDKPLGKVAARICLLTLHDDTRVLIVNSSMYDVGGLDTELEHMLCVLNSSRVELRDSHITNNYAQGLAVSGHAMVTLNSTTIEDNAAAAQGVGVAASQAAMVCITGGSRVIRNIAMATGGGGVAASGTARVIITGRSTVTNNTSYNSSCGGIRADGESVVFLDGMSTVANNTSHSPGAGVCADEFGSFCVRGGSHVSQNVAKNASAGGIVAIDHAYVEIGGGGHVSHNIAHKHAGGVAASGNARVLIHQGSVISHNAALNGYGGGMTLMGHAAATVRGGSMVTYNTAANASGGGIFTDENSSLVLEGGGVVAHNVAVPADIRDGGGGLDAEQYSVVIIRGASVITDNVVFNSSGGGMLIAGHARVSIAGRSCVVGNRAYNRPGGGVAVMYDGSLVLTGGSVIANNTAQGGGGIYTQFRANVLVTNGSRIANNSPNGTNGGGIAAWGQSKVNITNGVQFQANLPSDLGAASNIFTEGLTALHMDATVMDQTGPLSRCHNTVYRELDGCGQGDYKAARSCECCPATSYSFESNITFAECKPCPAFAVCPGADKVVPITGYWHSSPMAVQMHACPLTSACGVGGTCQPGYQGNLCGSCAPGYGMTLPFRCAQCMSPARQLGLYILLSCITVVFVAVTVWLTWMDNVEGSANLRPSDLIKVLVAFLQYLVILGSITAPWPQMLRTMFSASTVVFAAASGQALSIDCWLQHFVHSSAVPLAIQRQLVNFVAPVAVVVCVILFQLFFSAMLCWCQRMLPLFMCPTAHRRAGGRQASPWRVLLRQVPVACIVVAFYAYPTLVKAALSFFACVRIDDASQGPYAMYAVRNHTQGYWVYDVEQECFTGWHRAWAFGMGVPAVLVLCAGVPAVVWVFLHANRGRSGEPSFREHFGFLYRNYTDDKVWWEAVWAVQTVLLTTVSVFHHAIKAYYSIVLLNIMFLGIAVLQASARPCVHTRLQRLQLAASACLYLTAFATLSLFTVYGYEVDTRAVPTLIGVVLLVVNCTFVLWCLYSIMACTVLGHRILTALCRLFVCGRPSCCADWVWPPQHAMLMLPCGKGVQRPSTANDQGVADVV